jgi:putative chitinase
MSKTTEEWAGILSECGVEPAVVEVWAPAFAEVIQDDTFSAGDADIIPFIGQTLVETGKLKRLEENLSYSAERLMAVWPRRFPTYSDAAGYAHQPEALANKTYGGRMGNDEPGDGWKYRGRGIPMITGKFNYSQLGQLMGLDLLNDPDQLAEPATALRCGIHWWEGHIPDSILEDTKKVSEAVNGGDIGLKDRVAMTDLVRSVMA